LGIAPDVMGAELTPEPQWISDVDIQRVVDTPDGGFAIQRRGAVELLYVSGAHEVRLSASDGQSLYMSDDGVYCGIATHRHGAADFAPTAAFELQDANGAIVWRSGASDDVAYTISNDGDVVGMRLNINIPDQNQLTFYGDRGDVIAKVVVPHLTGGRFDSSGERYFAMSALGGITAFDRAGSALWQFPGARLFATTQDGRTVATVDGERLHVLLDGAPIASRRLDEPLVRRIAISPDGSRVAIAERQAIKVYRATDLDLLWTADSGAPNQVFTSVDIAGDDGWVVAGVARDLGRHAPAERRHPDGEVRAYDVTGTQIHHMPMEFDVWNIWTPTAILGSEDVMTVTTRRGIFQAVLP